MGELQTQLEARLHPLAGPFLFVGAGLSRRYAGLPSWEGLLRHFSSGSLQPYEYYRGQAGSDFPLTASKIASDFYQAWWSDDSFSESRALHAEDIGEEASPLKVEVARYVRDVVDKLEVAEPLVEEWAALQRATVDGIITTNYDAVLERAFPDFEVFVGQDELLFSDTQGIAEIYKIHGSASDPNSLVLTAEDYKNFHERNPYLAAKLLTVFVEHPVVFLGYSLTDQNIQEILQSLIVGLREQNVSKLQQRLIFVEWAEGASPSIADTVMPIGEVTIPITRILVPDFVEVFNALGKRRRALPAKILRLLKEQVYEIVLTNDPTERLVAYADIESASAQEVEVVFGVGAKFATQGIVGLSRWDVILDVLGTSPRHLPAQQLLDEFYQRIPSNWWVPGFKYLFDADHLDEDGELKGDTSVSAEVQSRVATIKEKIAAACGKVSSTQPKCTMAELRALHNNRWLLTNCFKLPVLTEDVAGLHEFLAQVWAEDEMTQPEQSNFARAVVVWDYLHYGPGRSQAPAT